MDRLFLLSRHFSTYALLAFLFIALPACSTTERAADTTADTAEDVAEGTADVAEDVGEAVADAAGTAWNTVTDLFDDDPDADAAVLVRPTSAGSAQGTVTFTETDGGLRVNVSLRDLAPGAHGIHIHENAACGPADSDGDGQPEPAGAAGGHWDPHATNDHGAPTDDVSGKHAGDLGNIEAGADGTAETTILIDAYHPDQHAVAGHALVVHSGRDDLETDPAGDSGTRVGCGVIEARN